MSSNDEIGEQLHLEWQRDPASQAVWEAICAVKSGEVGGRERLIELGAMGSNIAKISLAKYFLHGYHSFEKDMEAGLGWLESASKAGSVEAKFGLAQHLHYLGKSEEAKRLYRELSDIEYAPAQYRLARILLKEDNGEGASEARRLLQAAEKNGNLHAANAIADLYLGLTFGVAKWPEGVLRKLRVIIPFLKAGIREPNSDKFRR